MFLAEQSAAAVPAVFKQLAESNEWARLLPEICVAGLSLVVLINGMLLNKSERWFTPAVVKFFLLLIAAFTSTAIWLGKSDEAISFGGLVSQHGAYTDVLRLFFLLTAFAVTHLGSVFLRASKLAHNEFYHLVLVATAAMMLLVQSNHFVLFFVALETVAVTLYVLVGYNRNSAFSLEAGVKYLITGGLSSALLLAGIVLLYGLGGNTALNPHAGLTDMLRFDHLQVFVTAHQDLVLVKAAVALVLAGVAFKIGAFPFNTWIPDVYQGAPSPVTAFLAIGSKAAGIFALILLCVLENAPFYGIDSVLLHILLPVTALTLLLGNISALSQINVKRLMGLSGMSHAGFLLLGVVAAIAAPDENARFLAIASVVAYLFVYMFSSTIVFGVIGHVAPEDDARGITTDYNQLYRRNPVLGLLLAIGVGSLAGVPPTLGFLTKLLVLAAAFKSASFQAANGSNGLFGVIAIALVCVAMGVFYYFSWLREAYDRNKTVDGTAPAPILVGVRSRIILSVFAVIVLFGFLFCGGFLPAIG